MQLVIKRISKQLNSHFGSFLGKPAPIEEIRSLERTIGVSVPNDLKELYQLHNGETEGGPGLFFGMSFLPLSGILDEWQSCEKRANDGSIEGMPFYAVPAESIKDDFFNKRWIPFAADFRGNFLAVDLDPGTKGTPGQVISFGLEENTRYVVARSATDLIEFISKTLLEGPYTIDGEETWSYSDAGNLHFFHALEEMPLPVLHPESAVIEDEDIAGNSPEETMYVDGEIIKTVSPDAGHHPGAGEFSWDGNENLDGVKSLSVSIFSVEQWERVANASQLEHLHIQQLVGVTHQDLTLFRDMKNLQSLTIEQCNFGSLQFLTYIKNLKDLTLIDCAVADASAINETPLEVLELRHTPIENLEVLAESPSLQTFSGSFRQFQNLQAKMSRPVDFSRIIGGMTDREMDFWISRLQEE